MGLGQRVESPYDFNREERYTAVLVDKLRFIQHVTVAYVCPSLGHSDGHRPRFLWPMSANMA